MERRAGLRLRWHSWHDAGIDYRGMVSRAGTPAHPRAPALGSAFGAGGDAGDHSQRWHTAPAHAPPIDRSDRPYAPAPAHAAGRGGTLVAPARLRLSATYQHQDVRARSDRSIGCARPTLNEPPPGVLAHSYTKTQSLTPQRSIMCSRSDAFALIAAGARFGAMTAHGLLRCRRGILHENTRRR